MVCENTADGTDVSHYYNERTLPILLSSSEPQLGLSSTLVKSEDGNFTCLFTRSNQESNEKYYNIDDNTNLYMIVAFGSGNFDAFKNNLIFILFEIETSR